MHAETVREGKGGASAGGAISAPTEPKAVPHGEEEEPPLPVFSLAMLAIAMFTNAFSLTILFPFVGAMVETLGLTHDKRELGFYAGYIGAGFMAGRLCTSYAWGWFSDRYGRKPVIVVGMAGMVVFSIGFGLSWNFAWALAMRFFTGFFNGIVGTGKTMVSELCTDKQQARGMSVVTATWGLGLVIGPAVGGVLSLPGDKWPDAFPPGSLFHTFPYLLPMVIAGVFGVVGLIPTLLYLPETLPADVLAQHSGDALSPSRLACCRPAPASDYAPTALSEQDEGLELPAAGAAARKLPDAPASASAPPPPSLLQNRVVMTTVTMYAVWSTANIIVNEVVPLWALAPRPVGGIDTGTSEIGAVMGVVGVFLIVFQVFVYPPLAACFPGPLHMLRAATMVYIPVLLFMPVCGQVEAFWPRMVILTAFNAVRSAIGTAAFTSIFQLINNSVPSSRRGAVNGLGMVVGSVGKALGPAIGANVFAWSLSSGNPPPLDYGFTFYMCAAIGGLTCAMAYLLPPSLNAKLAEEEGEEEGSGIGDEEDAALLDGGGSDAGSIDGSGLVVVLGDEEEEMQELQAPSP